MTGYCSGKSLNFSDFNSRYSIIWFIFESSMENREQIKRIESFLKQVVVGELGKLQHAGLSYMQFVLMGQAIEVLGGFFDSKPMKAKGQSSRRFSAGVRYLLGGRYRLLNENDYLYDKLRNQMTHTFIPAKDLLLLNRSENVSGYAHLDVVQGRLVMISEDFYQDICLAAERLLKILEEGRLKPKNIVFGDDE